MRSYNPLFCIICILSLAGLIAANLTITSGSLNGTVFESAQFYKKGDDFNSRFTSLSGALILASNPVLNNSIVYLYNQPGQFFYTKVFELQDQGIIGIVYATPTVVPGQYFCIYRGEDMSKVRVPITEVSRGAMAQLEDLLNTGESVQVTISSEGNPWTAAIHSIAVLVVFRIFLAAISFLLFCWSFYKLVSFICIQGSHFNVPQVCLALETLANVRRLFTVAVDPLSCYFVFGFTVGNFTDTISVPYEFATFVLISFYWHEMLGATFNINPFLGKLLIPFFVITLGLLAADLFISIASTVSTIITTTIALPIIYVIVSSGFLVFYMVTARRIVIQMRSKDVMDASADPRRLESINKLNKKMILNAITRGLFILAAVLFLIPAVAEYPVSQVVLVAITLFIIMLDSAARIHLFSVPKNKIVIP